MAEKIKHFETNMDTISSVYLFFSLYCLGMTDLDKTIRHIYNNTYIYAQANEEA